MKDSRQDEIDRALSGLKEKKNLFECPDCGKEVSRRARSCPGCGAPIGEGLRQHSDKPIRVDTGENFLNRNRGCADLIIYVPLILILVFIIFSCRS